MSHDAPGPTGQLDRRDVLRTTGAGLVGAAAVPTVSAQEGPPEDRGRGEGRPTKAILTVDPERPSPGETVRLSGDNSLPGGDAEAIETYAFEVRDGDGDLLLKTSGPSATANVTLPSAGEYVATLSVTDSVATYSPTDGSVTLAVADEPEVSRSRSRSPSRTSNA